MTEAMEALHPGQILRQEILDKLDMSQNHLAQMIHVPANRIHDIVRGRRSVTADTDLRLCRFFGLPEGYWLRLQNAYDLGRARDEALADLDTIVPYRKKSE